MPKLTIRLDMLKACAFAASTEETRYYLNGVNVDADAAGNVYYTATDGHCLLAAWDRPEAIEGEPAYVGSLIIPSAVIAAVKIGKKDATTATLEVTPAADPVNVPACSIQFADGRSAGFKPVDGTFPDHRRVIPATVTGEPAQFNPELLTRLQKAGKVMGCQLPILAYNGLAPAIVRWSDDSFFGVVMPHTKGAAPETLLPEWFAAPVKPEVEQVAA